MATRKTTKHFIPHREEHNTTIVGVLEQLAPDQPTEDRNICLVCYDVR